MKDENKSELPRNTDSDTHVLHGPNQQRFSDRRREFVTLFAKISITAAPLLIFVSRAQAIHSKP
jgi:hypothetical protein